MYLRTGPHDRITINEFLIQQRKSQRDPLFLMNQPGCMRRDNSRSFSVDNVLGMYLSLLLSPSLLLLLSSLLLFFLFSFLYYAVLSE